MIRRSPFRILRLASALLLGGLVSACGLQVTPPLSLRGLHEIAGIRPSPLRPAVADRVAAPARPAALPVEPPPAPSPVALPIPSDGEESLRTARAMSPTPAERIDSTEVSPDSSPSSEFSDSRIQPILIASAADPTPMDGPWLSRLASPFPVVPSDPPVPSVESPLAPAAAPPPAPAESEVAGQIDGPAPAPPPSASPSPVLPSVAVPPAPVASPRVAPEIARPLPAPVDAEEGPLEGPALLAPARSADDRDLSVASQPAAAPAAGPEAGRSTFPLVMNEQVQSVLHYFQTKKAAIISRAFERARRYAGMMREIFREKGLPEDLVNLAFIESAVNPNATSRAKAAGIWQFVPSTGRLYGMQTSPWLDERRDPEKSTRGAADYLKSLYERFGCWSLALAAYNAGEGTLQRAIERQRTRDFWSLRLPKETRLFVPAFMAMTIISQNPTKYGFSPPADEPYDIDTVDLRASADLSAVARAAGTTLEHIRELNPELVRGMTPPHLPRYTLRIPRGLRADVLEAMAQTPAPRRPVAVSHRVRKGETPGAIAKRYGVTTQALLEANALSGRSTLKPGARLVIPGVLGAGSGRSGARVEGHTVRKGETLGSIAKAHAISTEDLRRWNGLSDQATLRPGRVLQVRVAEP